LADAAPTGALLRAYLAATAWAGPLAERHLRKRLARGKENPGRWLEKLGEASLSHPLVTPVITPRFVPSCTPEMLQVRREEENYRLAGLW
jgi:cytosine/adenosine deaminase-related metal-dependent hydrolase